ncbi:outer membrane protein [Asaia krungthepensis NRIC 0535]|uniref:Outer membrane protein n=1 Tax=Asaia krungthepensis NRIC 0535 TaxID=1307925 RepID=A0ABQ0Q426_9PROT|nr:outer membrane protein [Asaia krungthepensis NRIC 0535]
MTWYVSGSVSATGAVVLSNIGTLTISKGAVVSGATLSGGIPTVSVLNGGAMVSSTEINGYLRVASGGVVSGNTLNSDEVTLSAGASSVNDVFMNYGPSADGNAFLYVSSGASLLGATMTSGATAGLSAYVSSGATVSGLTLSSGAAAYVASGSVAADINGGAGSYLSMATAYGSGSANIVLPPASPVVLTGGTWTAKLIGTKTYYVSGSVSATGAVILSGIATLTVSSGAVVSGAIISGSVATVSVMSGGTMENSLVLNGYVSAAGGATLSANVLNSDIVYLYSGARSIHDTYINSGAGTDGLADVYVYSGASISTPYIGSAAGGGYTVWVSSGASISDPTLVRNGGQLVVSGGSVTTPDPGACFLAGTLLETDEGRLPVEQIRIGDHVMTYGSEPGPREVIWAGCIDIKADPSAPDDLSNYPVRILRDAFGENRPFKDLLVTSEHCFLLDGGFVPVRMLVNGRSIFYDKSLGSYRYYHIETASHSIIMADGVLSESYLDTGKRRSFRQTGGVHVLGGRTLSWADAAAPLMTHRAHVEKLFRDLDDRAALLPLARHKMPEPEIGNDPALRLLTDEGEWVMSRRVQNGQFIFPVPANAQTVFIVSNTCRPNEVIGPFVDDRRELGVLVGEIALYDSYGTLDMSAALGRETMEGWNDIEPGGWRWTSGRAKLDLPERCPGGLALLAVKVEAAGPYHVCSNEEPGAFWSDDGPVELPRLLA